MPRIEPVSREGADAATVQLLDGVKKKMGMVPNLIATMAHSTATANAYLGFSQALSTGTLPARLREQIALVVGETNSCDYCLAAHTALGKRAGLSEQETFAAREATAEDAKERVALEFARDVVAERGVLPDERLQALREAGYTEGQITEIIANVALNIFTNYFNHLSGTTVDFPEAPALSRA